VVAGVLVGILLGIVAITPSIERGKAMQHALCILTLVVGLFLSGCGDIAHWNTRTFYGIDCRPEKRQNGNCVPVKKGGNDVTTAQP
jgi:hypothetical protein